MKSLDELIEEKICELVNCILSKYIKPDITIDKVRELDKEMITKLKKEYGIEGIILDVDKTLRKNMNKIPKCNQEWIDEIKGQFKIIIVSNGKDCEIKKFFEEKGIDYIGFANKPLKRNFIKACKKMNVEPEKVLVVGDSLFDDIHGGKRNNMKTALVKEVEDEER